MLKDVVYRGSMAYRSGTVTGGRESGDALPDMPLVLLPLMIIRASNGLRSQMLPSVIGRTLLVAGAILAVAGSPAPAQEAPARAQQQDVEAFDGSWRLETGGILTGGYMVEGDGFWIFADIRSGDQPHLFRRDGNELVSFVPPNGAIRIEFLPGADHRPDELIWHEDGREQRGKRVFPHDSRKISFASADGTRLRGRLLTPRCEGPHPAIVMVHGSGRANRYGGTFHTFLLQRGVAVVAYDKRGYTPDEDAWREPDLAEMSADAAAALEYAADLPEIDAQRIGLWGGSQGGWTVPPAALQAPRTAYMILRAGAAVTEAETNLHEIRQEARAEGLEGLDLDYAMDLRREVYDLAMRGRPVEEADALVAPYLDEPWYRTAFGDGPISEIWSEHWWAWAQRNLAVESASAVAQFDGPVLWFLGEKDQNVPLVTTRAALERAFDAAPGDDHELVVVKDAPHSFVVPRVGAPPGYAAGVFSGMEEWLAERGFTDESCWE